MQHFRVSFHGLPTILSLIQLNNKIHLVLLLYHFSVAVEKSTFTGDYQLYNQDRPEIIQDFHQGFKNHLVFHPDKLFKRDFDFFGYIYMFIII